MEWDRPGDERLTWYLDDHQCPTAVGPLTQSVYPYMFQAFGKVQRLRGRERPATLRILFVHGYLYVHFRPGSPLPEEGKEAARLSPLTWEREWLPKIQANLDRLNRFPLETLDDDELSAALQDGLKTLARHWEIHHSLSFTAVNDLVAWYHNQFPDAPEGEVYKLLQGLGSATVESDQPGTATRGRQPGWRTRPRCSQRSAATRSKRSPIRRQPWTTSPGSARR